MNDILDRLQSDHFLGRAWQLEAADEIRRLRAEKEEMRETVADWTRMHAEVERLKTLVRSMGGSPH